jgi:ketosteroid isomerase-like protein
MKARNPEIHATLSLLAFRRALDAYVAAVRTKDIEAFISIYADDVCVFDTWKEWSIRGADSWRQVVSEWFLSLGTDEVVVSITDVRATAVRGLAFGHATVTYTATSKDGAYLRSIDNRLTVALRKVGADWKIFHEHTSMPMDH